MLPLAADENFNNAIVRGLLPRRPDLDINRWFARRFSSAFRAILVAGRVSVEEGFWQASYSCWLFALGGGPVARSFALRERSETQP